MKLLRFISSTLILSVLLLSFVIPDSPFNKEDKETIAKAEKLNQSAQEYIDKANGIYSEIAELNSPDNKKSTKLYDKAFDNQLKALDLQKEANILEYSVYKKIISELKTNTQGNKSLNIELNLKAEKADELFYKAEKLRKEVLVLDKNQKQDIVSKLDEAQSFEKSGIIQQKEIIDIYFGKKELKNQKSTNSNHNTVINEDMLDSYLNFMNSNNSISSYESFLNSMHSDSISFQELREERDKITYKTEEQVSSEISEEYIEKQAEETQTVQLTEKEKDNKEEIKTVEERIVFKVQITADSKGLSQGILKKVYDHKKDISMINENGWKKYSIGNFNSYAEADKFRKGLGISDAFIAKYKDDNKVEIISAKEANKDVNNRDNNITSTGIIFKVQIAASKNKMTKESLNKIYSGKEKIIHNTEDGWHKYSIGNYKLYKEAKELKDKTKVSGAFIVAYKDGNKIPAYIARKEITSAGKSSNDKIVFKVQIAADNNEISSEKIHNIYSGFENLSKFEEDGWRKYAIGKFMSFDKANELRKKCNVKGAFVIAFKGNKKINVLEAKKLTRCVVPKIISNWNVKKDTKVYRVQIAASRKEFTNVQVKNIYCRELKVYLIKEDNWFKYSIGNFTNYKEAAKLKNKCGVNGAFVVIYKNGIKVK